MKITKAQLRQIIKEELASTLNEGNGDPSKKLSPEEEAVYAEPPLKEQDEKRYTLTLEWLEVMLKNHAALLGATDQEKIAEAAAEIVSNVKRNHYAPNPRDESPWAPGGPGAYPAGP